jgi:hypothetical protein
MNGDENTDNGYNTYHLAGRLEDRPADLIN